MGFTPFNINHENFSAIMDMLNQYADPASAVLREYVSNGIDAVRGMDDASVVVVLPDEDHKDLVIMDNGIGMSADFMQSTLSSYANSTKKGDGGSIGEKGIGSKSAFSVSDRFVIESVHDGVKATAVNDKNAGGLQITTEKTDAHNGTTVTIPVEDMTIRRSIRVKASMTLCGFDSAVLHVMNADGSDFEGMRFIDKDTMLLHVNDSFAFDICRRRNGIDIIQGGVRYAVSDNILRSVGEAFEPNHYPFQPDPQAEKARDVLHALCSVINRYGSYLGANVILSVKPNTLETNPSRESIISTPGNTAAIIDAIASAYDDIFGNDDSVDNAKRKIGGLVRRHLEDPAFGDLDWDGASYLVSCAYGLMPYENDSKGNCTYRKAPVSLGGHTFHDSLMIPADGGTVVFERRSNNRFSRMVENDVDGSKCNVMVVGSTVRMLAIVDDPDAVAECDRVVRNRRAYCTEAGLNEADIAYIMVSTGNPVKGLGFWDSKRTVSKVVECDDYKRTMETRAERVRKERAEKRKASGCASAKVTAITYGSPSRRTVLSLSDILAMKKKDPGIMLLQADHDDFYRFSKDIYKIDVAVSIAQRNAMHGGKWILVKNEGSKSLMKAIGKSCIGYDDIDYKGSLRSMVEGMLSELRNVDSRRARFQLLKGCWINGQNMFEQLINCEQAHVESSETEALIERLDYDYRTSTATRWDDHSKSLKLNGTLQSLRDVFGGEEWFDDMLHVEDGIENAIFDTANDIEMFKTRYPMIARVDKYGDGIVNDVIDYINVVDKASGRLGEDGE